MSNSKCVYYKEKEQKSIDGGITWVDTGNFRKGALISTQASQCGSYTNEYRWIKADYVCDNGNKYKGYKQQVSHDNGGSWTDTGVVDIGELISSNSKDCGYDEKWFTLTGDNNFICDGASKYKKKEMKYTRNSGTTWNSFNPPKFEKGDLIEKTSTDCAIPAMKVTYTNNTEKTFYNLTSIEEGTDINKRNAKSVEIYDGVTSIGKKAFYGLENLTNVTISNTVTVIGHSAFNGCWGLTGITLSNSLTSIGNSAFNGCRGLESVVLPNSLTSIGNFAFNGCWGLTGITLSDSLTTIGNYAFENCSALTGITIPNSVTSIGDNVFAWCTGLTTITVEATNPPKLGAYAIPDETTAIYVPSYSYNDYWFADGWSNYRSKIKKIPLKNAMKVTYTDGTEKTFTGLTRIQSDIDLNKANAKSVEVYDGVISIGNSAFENCLRLTNIVIPDSVTSIGNKAFLGCYAITGITLPNSITNIGDIAFASCSGLESVVLPNSLTSIGQATFMACSNLTSVVISNSITSIGAQAFADCTSLSSITLHDSVTSIGNWAFFGCYSLTTMTVNAVTPPSLGSDAIPTTIQTIYVPTSSVDVYKSATNWKDYADKIQAIPE